MSTNPTTEKSNEIKSEAPQKQSHEQRPGFPVLVELPHGHSDDNFQWTVNNEDVLLPEQRTTAVYLNRWGQAVIRQERNWDEESDPFMTISHENLPVVIARLQEIASAPMSREEPEPGEAIGGPR